MPQEFTLEATDEEADEAVYLRIDREFTLEADDDADEAAYPSINRSTSWGPTKETPYPGEAGGSPASIVGDPSGGLSSPSLMLPESAVQLVEPDGTHVAWLSSAKSWNFRRSKTTPGSGEAVLRLADAVAAQAVWPRQLRFFDRAEIRQRALIEDPRYETISQREEAGEEVAVGGPGALAIFGRYTLDPFRLDLQPVQSSMRFNAFHPDHPRASTWPHARNVGEYDTPTDWPGGGQNIWGPSGSHFFAPGGSEYLRGPAWTNPVAQLLAYLYNVDNTGSLQLDGAPIIDLSRLDTKNYLRTHEVRLFTSAGTHHLGSSGFNQGSATPGPNGNPGHVRAAVWTLDANGELDTLLHGTSTAWRAYEFPQVRPASLQRPGWTAGEILNYILDHIEAKSGHVFTRTFDGYRDTRGQLWPIIVDFTANCGDLLRVIQQLIELHCDLELAAGSDTLHAFLKDTRGVPSGAVLPDGYSDPTNGCLKSLRHNVEPPLFTVAKLPWEGGWVEVRNEAAIAAGVYVERKVDVPLVDNATRAEEIGEALVAVFGQERVQGSAEIVPRSGAQRPGPGFDVADEINAPDRDRDLAPQVVQTWSHAVDRNGKITWGIEYGDLLFDAEERLDDALAALGDGSAGGRTFQSLVYRAEPRPTQEQWGRQPYVFHHLATDSTGESDPLPIDDYQTIQAVTVHVPGGEGGTFELWRSGSLSPIDTFTVGAGVTTPITERGLAHKLQPGQSLTIVSDDPVTFLVVIHVA